MGLKETEAEILDRWNNIPAAAASIRILEYLASLPDDELKVLTFRTLSKAAGKGYGDTELVAAINILAGSSLALLDAHAFFVDDARNQYDLDDDEFELARATNEVVHPDTGELISNASAHLI